MANGVEYRNLTREELLTIQAEFVKNGNLNAAREISEVIEYYGRNVEVVKGRKVPKGIKGEVFWLKRYDYSNYGDSFGIYSNTRAGIKTESGEVYFTALNNLKIIE